jgi:hypothetical protein
VDSGAAFIGGAISKTLANRLAAGSRANPLRALEWRWLFMQNYPKIADLPPNFNEIFAEAQSVRHYFL